MTPACPSCFCDNIGVWISFLQNGLIWPNLSRFFTFSASELHFVQPYGALSSGPRSLRAKWLRVEFSWNSPEILRMRVLAVLALSPVSKQRLCFIFCVCWRRFRVKVMRKAWQIASKKTPMAWRGTFQSPGGLWLEGLPRWMPRFS